MPFVPDTASSGRFVPDEGADVSPGRAGLEAIQPSVKPEVEPPKLLDKSTIESITPRMLGGLQSLRDIAGKAMETSKLEGLGPAEMFGAVPKALESGAAVIPKIGETARVAGEKVGGAYKTIKETISDVFGTKIPAAKAEASSATKKAVEIGAQTVSKAAEHDAMRAKALTDVRGALDKKLAVAQVTPENLDIQGGTIRKAFTDAVSAAKAARAATADEMFSAVKQVAAAKEATGARVDTSAIEKSLKSMAIEAEGIPDLEGGLRKMLSAIKGRSKEPPVGPLVWAPEGVRPPVEPIPEGKTFEQLELTRRFLNDIGYSSEMEGYPAIIKGEARQAAKAVDEAMQKFVPEFAKYKDTYRKMSEPLESLGTRFGKAIAGTEGGLQEAAYSKIANADLPSRLFSKKEGIDLMVDALSGGKNAPPEARIAAGKQVDKMVENWITEGVRQKSPAKALEHLSSPQMRSALSSVPNVEAALKQQFGNIEGLDRTASQVVKLADEMKAKSVKTMQAAASMRDEIKMADTLAAQLGAKSQQSAYNAYVKALASGRKEGVIPEDQYKAAVALIDRAATIEEKAALAQRMVKRIAIVGGLIATGHEVAKYLP